MSKQGKKTKYYQCACGRKVPLDGIKVMRHRKPGSSEYCEDGAKSVQTPAMEAANEKVAERDKARIVQIKCVYPPCTTQVMVKAPPPGAAVGGLAHMQTLGGIPMCPKHADMLNFHVWFTTNVKMQPRQTAHGLITPGHQQFNPTLGKPPVHP